MTGEKFIGQGHDGPFGQLVLTRVIERPRLAGPATHDAGIEALLDQREVLSAQIVTLVRSCLDGG